MSRRGMRSRIRTCVGGDTRDARLLEGERDQGGDGFGCIATALEIGVGAIADLDRAIGRRRVEKAAAADHGSRGDSVAVGAGDPVERDPRRGRTALLTIPFLESVGKEGEGVVEVLCRPGGRYLGGESPRQCGVVGEFVAQERGGCRQEL